MKKNAVNNIKLGIFVVAGSVILIAGLYMIGSNRNIFGNTIRVRSNFYNVNGLMPGNNVRYAGIDIGTVDKISIENDSSVTVYMIIENKQKKFIKKNSVAAIGTDGLMGNKLVNINPGIENAPTIEDGDVIASVKPVESDEMIRTLNATNDNLAAITGDLRKFTSRLNKDRGILKFIEDSASAENIRLALEHFREVAENASTISSRLNKIAYDLDLNRGVAGVLLNDTAAATQLKSTLASLDAVSDSLQYISSGLRTFTDNINRPGGLLEAVSADTSLANDVKSSAKNIHEGTELLNENLKAMRQSPLFRKYFKDKGKKP
ncbi:MAG TPA: MlaD family protein [Bacteroidia bacterium]|nr:MlaD family protein [Bacteroidia bacterium]